MNHNTHFTWDSVYYSNATMAHSQLLGEKTFLPDMTENDSVFYPKDSTSDLYYSYPRMTVKLNQAWGQQWVNDAFAGMTNSSGQPLAGLEPAQADSSVTSTIQLQRNFPGVYITTSNPMQIPGQGALWYMNPYAPVAGIVFYIRLIGRNRTWQAAHAQGISLQILVY